MSKKRKVMSRGAQGAHRTRHRRPAQTGVPLRPGRPGSSARRASVGAVRRRGSTSVLVRENTQLLLVNSKKNIRRIRRMFGEPSTPTRSFVGIFKSHSLDLPEFPGHPNPFTAGPQQPNHDPRPPSQTSQPSHGGVSRKRCSETAPVSSSPLIPSAGSTRM